MSLEDFEAQARRVAPPSADLLGLRLAFDCIRGHDAAVAEFKAMLETACAGLSRELVPNDDVRDELCQDTYLLLLYGGTRYERGYLLTYAGRAPLRLWLRTVLVRQGIAHKRRRDRERPVEAILGDLVTDSDAPTPETALLKRRYAQHFRLAFRRSLASLSARERLVLRHSLIDGLNAEQIGRRFRVHRVTVARWMRSIRRRLLDETKAQLTTLLRTESDELDAIFGLIQSQFSPSFDALQSSGSSSS